MTEILAQERALVEERHEVVKETLAVKKVVEDVGKLLELKMRIKNK